MDVVIEIRSIVKECLVINFLCFSILSFETPKIFVLSLENLFLNLEKSFASTVQPGVSSFRIKIYTIGFVL